uniref:Carboxypeptidase regulatory-like domain-containing protein n=1 Tax=Parastrongyloides trichosuri TaxID=131310 RepID=A0A0N5A2S0_PARTI
MNIFILSILCLSQPFIEVSGISDYLGVQISGELTENGKPLISIPGKATLKYSDNIITDNNGKFNSTFLIPYEIVHYFDLVFYYSPIEEKINCYKTVGISPANVMDELNLIRSNSTPHPLYKIPFIKIDVSKDITSNFVTEIIKNDQCVEEI